MKNLIPLFLFLVVVACKQKEVPVEETQETTIEAPSKTDDLMKWICEQSEAYSGVLNSRQTWDLSYKDGVLTEQYFFDEQLQELTTISLKDIDRVAVEERFTNSVALYPKRGDTRLFKTLRYEDSEEKEIEAEYHNLKVDPSMRRQVKQKLEVVLDEL